MTRLLALLTVLAMLASACTSAGETQPDRSPNDCPQAYADGLNDWAAAGFSGTIAITREGELECAAGYGSADRADDRANTPQTVYSIGSVSKAFTAAAIYRLVDDHRLRLDDTAGAILPSLRGPAAHATVRQLLLHVSGLAGSIGPDHAPLSHAAAIRKLSTLRRAYAPGTHYLYSNAGYALLALIIDKVSGNYRRFMTTRILDAPGAVRSRGFWDGEPAAIGPRAVGYLDGGPTDQMGEFTGPHWALSGNGDLAMTTHDLAEWTYALFNGDILSQRSTRAITTGQVARGDGASATPGWVRFPKQRYGEPVIATSGGGGDIGHDVVVAWLPRSRRVVAIASNTPVTRAEDVLTAIGPTLVTEGAIPPPDEPRASVDPSELQGVAGTYRLDQRSSCEVSVHDDELAVTAHGRKA
ncbi:MAG: beta-lactamase family protein, partial [Actinomycetia bacterium]|nr:beta-lactamase family protein [Actinomycetes bacterium]